MMLDGPLPTMPEGNSVLVVMAHPDDAEFGCGGTIAKWAAAGKDINYLLCTSGDKGSSDPDIATYRLAKTRRAEQINAALLAAVTALQLAEVGGHRAEMRGCAIKAHAVDTANAAVADLAPLAGAGGCACRAKPHQQ